MTAFVYKITNTKNDKLYIGITTRTVEERFREHCNKRFYNSSNLTRAIIKHGSGSFKLEIIHQYDNIDIEELKQIEESYILSLNTVAPNGYNLLAGDKLHQKTKNKLTNVRSGVWEQKHKVVRKRRYLLTSPEGIMFCSIGTAHLKELFDLDPSKIVNVTRDPNSTYKGWKAVSLDGHINKSDYLYYKGRYECISLNEDKPSFCTYTISDLKQLINCELSSKTINHHINREVIINDYKIANLNNEILNRKLEYLPDAERFTFTTPEGIQFCRYGMDGLVEELGISSKGIYPLMNPNSRVYGRTHKGWSCVRVNESQIERDKLLNEKATKLAATKLQIKEDRKWWLVAKKKYLLTNLITNEQLCCYGLVHLKESHGLDGSCLIKVMKGKIKHHKNWTCIKIED
jgi:group I intron endonuclease